MRGLRSELLEPSLVRLAAQPMRFEACRAAWRAKPSAAPRGIPDVLSKQVG